MYHSMVIKTLIVLLVLLPFYWHVLIDLGDLNGMVPVLGSLVLAREIPGVGAPTIPGVLTFALVCFIPILVTPPIFKAFVEFLSNSTDPVSTVTELTMARPQNSSSINMLFIAHENCLDSSRAIIGQMVNMWMIIDTFRGPRIMIDTVVNIKGDRNNQMENSAFLSGASILFAQACLYQFLEMAWAFRELNDQNILKILSLLLSFFFVSKLWDILGKPEWCGRGQQWCLSKQQRQFLGVLGDGPMGLRLQVVKLALFLTIMLLSIQHVDREIARNYQIAVGVIGLILTLFLQKSRERFLGIALAALTNNFPIAMMSCCTSAPFTYNAKV